VYKEVPTVNKSEKSGKSEHFLSDENQAGEGGNVPRGGKVGGHMAIQNTSLGVFTEPVHPQTVWDQTELELLRAARTGTHKFLADNFVAYLNCFNSDDHYCMPDTAHCIDQELKVGGLAMIAKIMQDQEHDVSVDNAVQCLLSHCSNPWCNWCPPTSDTTGYDIQQAEAIIHAAIAYDVLYADIPTDADRAMCHDRIARETNDLVTADNGHCPTGRGWWEHEFVQNHNWVDLAAIGIAGQALGNQDWINLAQENFHKVKAVQDLVTDGSWHEGIGYMGYGLEKIIAYWLGAVRGGNTDDLTKMMSKVGRYILYCQLPNQPYVHVMTHGDWNWVRPEILPVLRWAGRRFRDPYAQEAARRWWDFAPRSGCGGHEDFMRADFGLHYALEYVAYDPTVQLPDMSNVPLDVYNEDQQSVIMRTSWDHGLTPPQSDSIVIGFKAGVFGGRGNYERMRNCGYPQGNLDYGHDHEDDLGLWIYGKGGWLLPEAVAYNCCYSDTTEYQSTVWHNTLLFTDDAGVERGQLGDSKTVYHETGYDCGSSNNPSWFFERDASMPMHESTDHYAFARGEGARLYKADLNITTLLRTVGLSREIPGATTHGPSGGFVVLQDRVAFGTGTNRMVRQLFHSMSPDLTLNDAPWVKLTNLHQSVLGVRVLSPANYAASIATQVSNNYQEFMDDDGRYGCVRVESPGGAVDSEVFLEVLWPTTTTEWDNGRPTVIPLDQSRPHRGFSIDLGTSHESWIFNLTGSITQAGDLKIEGSDQGGGDIGIKRAAADGSLERIALQGTGNGNLRLFDQGGGRLILESSSPYKGALEVAFTGTSAADLSGTAEVNGIQFYGPNVSVVLHRGRPVQWEHVGSLVHVIRDLP
jgi:hypothetical protein